VDVDREVLAQDQDGILDISMIMSTSSSMIFQHDHESLPLEQKMPACSNEAPHTVFSTS
jgi:hypothetical protein